MQMKLPGAIQQQYINDPRYALAQELAKAGGSTAPVASPVQGIARMLQGALAGYQQGNLKSEYQKRGQDYNATLAKALSGDQPMQERMTALTANPDTADLAQALQMKQLENQMSPDYAIKQAMLKSMGYGDTSQGAPTPAPASPVPSTGYEMSSGMSSPAPSGTPYSADTMKLMTIANPTMANAVVGQQKLAIDQKEYDLKEKQSSPDYKANVAEAEKIAQNMAMRMDESIKAGQMAQTQLNQVKLAQQIPLDGGALAPAKAKADAVFKAMGVDTKGLGLENATDAQAFTGIMQNVVLSKMQAQKGPQTENDAKRIEMTVANLGNTPEARQFLLDVAAAQLEREAEYGQFLNEWISNPDNKGSYKGAEKAWNESVGSKPLPIDWSKYRSTRTPATLTPESIMQMNDPAEIRRLLGE